MFKLFENEYFVAGVGIRSGYIEVQYFMDGGNEARNELTLSVFFVGDKSQYTPVNNSARAMLAIAKAGAR